MHRSTISNNLVTDAGGRGGISCSASGTLLACTISRNRTADFIGGGGISCISQQGPLALVNSTLSGNFAGDYGGGGIVLDSSAEGTNRLTAINCTITDNFLLDGSNDGVAGVFALDDWGPNDVQMINSIVAGNHGVNWSGAPRHWARAISLMATRGSTRWPTTAGVHGPTTRDPTARYSTKHFRTRS